MNRDSGKVTAGQIGERMIDTERWRSEIEHVLYLEHRFTYEWIKPRCKGYDVVEVGCGLGYGTALIAESASRVQAFETDRELVRQLEARMTGNVSFELYDGYRLPLPSESCDLCFSSHVIEYVADAGRFLGEHCRVVRPGGTVIAVTPNAATRLLPGQKPWNPYHLKEYTAKELEDAVALIFREQQVLGVHGSPRIVALHEAKMRSRRTPLLRTAGRIFPDPLWRALLKSAGRMRSVLRSAGEPNLTEQDFEIGLEDFRVSHEIEGALSLVAVCRH